MGETMDKDLLNKLNKFCDENGVKLKDLVYDVSQLEREKRDVSIKEETNSHKNLVGKCYRRLVKPRSGMFPEMYRYYKVISERASTSSAVSCLVFDEKPTYWFEYQAHLMGFPGDYFLGEFDFEPISVKEIRVDTLKNMEEIMEGVFKYELNWLGRKIAELPWYADHYRFGGKLPTDEGWEKKND
jgi:hypothetical protein